MKSELGRAARFAGEDPGRGFGDCGGIVTVDKQDDGADDGGPRAVTRAERGARQAADPGAHMSAREPAEHRINWPVWLNWCWAVGI